MHCGMMMKRLSSSRGLILHSVFFFFLSCRSNAVHFNLIIVCYRMHCGMKHVTIVENYFYVRGSMVGKLLEKICSSQPEAFTCTPTEAKQG